jgi:arylsulfatase A-like enzyme
LIIISSDHGEAFYEHQDFLHGNTVYDEIIKIPLIIKFPKNYTSNNTKKITTPVSLIDIKPTISEFVGGNSKNSQGISLIELIKSNTIKRKFLISQQEYWNGYRPIAIYDDKFKMIYFASYGKHSDNFKNEYFQQQYDATKKTTNNNLVKEDAADDSDLPAYFSQLKKEAKENGLNIGNNGDYFVLYPASSDKDVLDAGKIGDKKNVDNFITELKGWLGQQKVVFDLSQNEVNEDKETRNKLKELGYAR